MSDFRPDEKPIEISASAVPNHLMSLLRDGLVGVTAWLVGKGYIDEVTGTQLVSMGLILGTVAWRQFVVHRGHKRTVTIAQAAPDSIAVVKQ